MLRRLGGKFGIYFCNFLLLMLQDFKTAHRLSGDFEDFSLDRDPFEVRNIIAAGRPSNQGMISFFVRSHRRPQPLDLAKYFAEMPLEFGDPHKIDFNAHLFVNGRPGGGSDLFAFGLVGVVGIQGVPPARG